MACLSLKGDLSPAPPATKGMFFLFPFVIKSFGFLEGLLWGEVQSLPTAPRPAAM